MSENTITREAAAKRLGCSMRTVERMLRDGRLSAIRHPDGRLAVDRADLELVMREPKLLETRRARTDETSPTEPAVGTVTVQAVADPRTEVREPEPTRPSLLERVTPLSLEPDPILPATGAPAARRARRSRLRRPMIAIATALALAAVLVWLLASSGSPRPEASRKPATHHRETPAPTVPADSTTPRSERTIGGREHPSPIPTSRGGLASLIVISEPARVEPATSGQTIAAATKPSSGRNSSNPSTSSTNCGFGSLTYGGC